MDEYQYRDHKCSECGREFTIPTQIKYQYKMQSCGKTHYQCSYTCYDHALLRIDNPDNYYPRSRYSELVKKCETSMLGQGKKILYPIKLR